MRKVGAQVVAVRGQHLLPGLGFKRNLLLDRSEPLTHDSVRLSGRRLRYFF